MQVYTSLERYRAAAPAAVTIGTFDGVHLGHRVILEHVRSAARAIQGQAVVITFDPHPRLVLQPGSSLQLLQTLDEKISSLRAAGIDQLLVVPFTPAFAQKTSAQFIQEVLVQTVAAKQLVIGYDHRFGAGRGGGLDELRVAGEQHGFGVEEIPAQQIDEANVSSTRIRTLLQAGQVQDAAHLLGYDYELSGMVVRGQQLGRQLGYPTANLHIADPHKLLPALGIYVVEVQLPDGHTQGGLLSIGTNPTVSAAGSVSVEVFVIDYAGDLYDQILRVSLLARLRPEAKFANLDALVAQMQADERQARQLLAQRRLMA